MFQERRTWKKTNYSFVVKFELIFSHPCFKSSVHVLSSLERLIIPLRGADFWSSYHPRKADNLQNGQK